MLGQAGEIRVRSGAGEDLCDAGSHNTASFALERAGYDGRAAALPSAANDLLDERDQIIIEPNSDLLAYTNTVREWERRASLARLFA